MIEKCSFLFINLLFMDSSTSFYVLCFVLPFRRLLLLKIILAVENKVYFEFEILSSFSLNSEQGSVYQFQLETLILNWLAYFSFQIIGFGCKICERNIHSWTFEKALCLIKHFKLSQEALFILIFLRIPWNQARSPCCPS